MRAKDLLSMTGTHSLAAAVLVTALTLMTNLASLHVANAKSAQHLSFTTSDKVQLSADIYSPTTTSKHPVVILLHQLGKSNRVMSPLIAPLLKNGNIVINVDMRGHGNSSTKNSQPYTFERFTKSDWAMLPNDLSAFVDQAAKLPNADATKVAIVGASIGANAALIEAKSDSRVKAVVALSPGLTYHELSPKFAMSGLDKPALIISSRDDAYSADSGLKLSRMDSKCSFDLIPDGGHGAAMFAAHPEITGKIATWLHKVM